jgi:hypothetical protein
MKVMKNGLKKVNLLNVLIYKIKKVNNLTHALPFVWILVIIYYLIYFVYKNN